MGEFIMSDNRTDNKIYYIGNVKNEDGTEWELQGIFEKEEDAVQAIKESNCENCFVSSIDINTMYPLETINRDDYNDVGYYPLYINDRG